jgi:hypothetical protein
MSVFVDLASAFGASASVRRLLMFCFFASVVCFLCSKLFLGFAFNRLFVRTARPGGRQDPKRNHRNQPASPWLHRLSVAYRAMVIAAMGAIPCSNLFKVHDESGEPRSFLMVGWTLLGGQFLLVFLLALWELAFAAAAFSARRRGGGKGGSNASDASPAAHAAHPGHELRRRRVAAATSTMLACVLSAVSVQSAQQAPAAVRVEVPLALLPPAMDGFRIVQLSDLHVGPTVGRRQLQAAVDIAVGLKPDMVVLTGDFVDGPVASLRTALEPLGQLREHARHGVRDPESLRAESLRAESLRAESRTRAAARHSLPSLAGSRWALTPTRRHPLALVPQPRPSLSRRAESRAPSHTARAHPLPTARPATSLCSQPLVVRGVLMQSGLLGQVYYVTGNHEYYHGDAVETRAAFARSVSQSVGLSVGWSASRTNACVYVARENALLQAE